MEEATELDPEWAHCINLWCTGNNTDSESEPLFITYLIAKKAELVKFKELVKKETGLLGSKELNMPANIKLDTYIALNGQIHFDKEGKIFLTAEDELGWVYFSEKTTLDEFSDWCER